MSPIAISSLGEHSTRGLLRRDSDFVKGHIVAKPTDPDALILEAWAQGYLVGALIIMSFITMANMRKGILLHKLILLELIMGLWQGFWLFFQSPVYAWWLSVSAIFLNASWSLHNVISWMKLKPFLSRPVSLIFIGTIILAQPYWVVEIYANFTYFHGINDIFLRTRPWEALCRDPWWIYTTVALFYTIATQYEMSLKEIIRISPRFGIMLLSMLLSIIFIVFDICSVTGAFKSSLPVGINPFWKLAFVFKCLTDSVVLDDFKTALDRLRAFKISRLGSFSQDMSDSRNWNDGNLVDVWEELDDEGRRRPGATLPSPDNTLIHASHFPGFKLKQEPNKVEHREHSRHPSPIVTPDYVARDFCNSTERTDSLSGLEPEDIVPSALIDRPSSMQNAHIKDQTLEDFSPWKPNLDRHGTTESDYADALREVQRESKPPSPSKTKFPRRTPP